MNKYVFFRTQEGNFRLCIYGLKGSHYEFTLYETQTHRFTGVISKRLLDSHIRSLSAYTYVVYVCDRQDEIEYVLSHPSIFEGVDDYGMCKIAHDDYYGMYPHRLMCQDDVGYFKH